MFIVTCYGRGILGNALKERGMAEASGAIAVAAAKRAASADGGEFITVSEYESTYDTQFTINVPIELVAAQKVGAECRPQ
jgi:hypothetical protein